MPSEWDEPPADEDDDDEFGPGDPDYDLSEAHGYSEWEPASRHWPVPPWLLAVVSLIVAAALVLPSIFLVLRYG